MKLLLDEHISPAVARGLSGTAGLIAHGLRDWQGDVYLEASDAQILQAAAVDEWTLVTYDLRTIPTLLKDWGEQGIAHAGVILIDERSIARNDIGALIRALSRLALTSGGESWRNRIVFLSR